MSEAISPPATQPKADPESLALRGAPARVTRFRRGAIIGIAALTSTAIIGISWFALRPASLTLVASDNEQRNLAAKTPSDALAGAPAGYGDVPKLGPPLPGDLGRPILKHQRELDAGVADPTLDGERLAAEAAEAERQRKEAEQRAARTSSVMMARSGAPGASPTDVPSPVPVEAVGADANGQKRARDLVGKVNEGDAVSAHRLQPAVSPWTLQAGTVIAASLITGLNSDLPGFVTAQVTENVFDSVTGDTMLIPQGSRLIGSYDSVVAYGQSRALVVWQRVILPDGASILIDNVPATDTRGYAGLSDGIDRHSWQLLKGVVLSTLLGVGTELGSGSSDSDLVEAIRSAAQQSGARAGDQLVGRSLDIQPTLTVRPGWPLRVVVHKDIVLRPWNPVRK